VCLVQRVSGADALVPLSLAAVDAAKIVTLGVLARALTGGAPPVIPRSQCGRDHLRFAAAIVHRLLNSLPSADTKSVLANVYFTFFLRFLKSIGVNNQWLGAVGL